MLGERLKKLREAHGLTQECLARAAGIDRTKVCKLEKGRLVGRNVDDMRALARAFALTFDAFDRYVHGEIKLAEVLPPACRKRAA